MTTDAQLLQHVVLLRFPEPLNEADDAWLRATLAGLPEKIDTLNDCRVGSDLTGERSQGWQYLLYTTFADQEGLHAYNVHPAHQEFVAFLNERGCERLAFDYFF
jgi:hypothetical protein